MADFTGQDLTAGAVPLVEADPGEIPSHTWDSIAAGGSTTVVTGLSLEAGLILEPGVIITL